MIEGHVVKSFLSVASKENEDDDDATRSGEGSGSDGLTVDESSMVRSLSNMPWFLYPANNR